MTTKENMNPDKTAQITAISQRKAARVAGFMFLFTTTTGLVAEIIRTILILPGNAAETGNNIMANLQLFRFGIAIDLITFMTAVILSVSLYILLKPVSKNLALLALLWRFGENIILMVGTVSSYKVLHLLSGPDYLTVFETGQLHALVQLFTSAHKTGYDIGMLFIFLGGIVFSYLLLKSNYIPRILSAYGIFAYSVALVGTFAIFLLPTPPLWLSYVGVPVLPVELAFGFWLLIKGAKIPEMKSLN